MEENIYITKILMPKLNDYKKMFEDAGITARLSMDKDEIPGLVFFPNKSTSVFMTVILGEENPDLVRLTVDYLNEGETMSEDVKYRSAIISTMEDISAESLKNYASLLLDGRFANIYPTAEDTSDTLLPRTQMLYERLLEEEIEDAEIVQGKLPFIFAVDDDYPLVISYEELSDNEYLLHFRYDLPYDEKLKEDIAEKVEIFNKNHAFTQCDFGMEDLEIYEVMTDNILTLHACTVDNGAMKEIGFYGRFTGWFEDDIKDFLDLIDDRLNERN